MKVFISYSSQNSETAFQICEFIESKGWNCFIAPRDIHAGCSYAEEIILGLDSTDIVLLLLSQPANDSAHVLREIERAVNAGIPILTYKLEEVELNRSLEYFLMPFQWLSAKEDPDRSKLWEGLCSLATEEAKEDGAALAEHAVAKGHAEPKKTAEKNPWKLISCVLAAVLCVVAVIAVIALVKNTEKGGKGDTAGQNVIEDYPISEPTVAPKYQVGDYVHFGCYEGESIEWRILSIDENNHAEMISHYVVSMKSFDAAESGRYSHTKEDRLFVSTEEYSVSERIEMFGSSRWMTSNLRTWLNSDAESVEYADMKPYAEAKDSYVCGYNDEEGFLNQFSLAERAAIVSVTNRTDYYDPETGELAGTDETVDSVYLLASDELYKLKDNGMSIFATPTKTAIDTDYSFYYNNNSLEYKVETIDYWLRDARRDEKSYYYVNHVTTGYSAEEISSRLAAVDGLGVRPVITIDLEKYQPEVPVR